MLQIFKNDQVQLYKVAPQADTKIDAAFMVSKPFNIRNWQQ